MRRILYPIQISLRSIFLLTLCLLSHNLLGQISYGGQPLPLSVDIGLRTFSPSADIFIEMPEFNISDEESLSDYLMYISGLITRE